MNERLYKGKYMNKSIIIKEKQGKKSRRTTFCLQQQETEKNQVQCFIFGLDLMFNQQDQKLTQSFLKSAEFRLRKEVFGCFYTHCGSNSEESEQERSISHNLHKTIKNVEHFSFTLKKISQRERIN